MATAKKKSHGLGSGLNVLIPQNNPPKEIGRAHV